MVTVLKYAIAGRREENKMRYDRFVPTFFVPVLLLLPVWSPSTQSVPCPTAPYSSSIDHR